MRRQCPETPASPKPTVRAARFITVDRRLEVIGASCLCKKNGPLAVLRASTNSHTARTGHSARDGRACKPIVSDCAAVFGGWDSPRFFR